MSWPVASDKSDVIAVVDMPMSAGSVQKSWAELRLRGLTFLWGLEPPSPAQSYLRPCSRNSI